jgi:hypothetical protein
MVQRRNVGGHKRSELLQPGFIKNHLVIARLGAIL